MIRGSLQRISNVDEAYEAELFKLEDAHWWYRGRRRVLSALIEVDRTGPFGRILDVGCGTGRNLQELRRYGDVVGVEPSAAAVSFARASELPVQQAEAEALPFDDATFDFITALDVIEHIEDDRGALREMRRVLAPAGSAIITVPAYQWLWSAHDDMNLHKRRYTATLLRDRAESAGWAVVRLTYFNSLLLPPIALHRRLQSVIGRSSPTVNDFKRTPRGLNSLLEIPLRLEAAVIRRGLRFPAGVSLGAVLQPRGV